MEHQNQIHSSWKIKKDNFSSKVTNKWKNSVFIPKFLKKEDKEQKPETSK